MLRNSGRPAFLDPSNLRIPKASSMSRGSEQFPVAHQGVFETPSMMKSRAQRQCVLDENLLLKVRLVELQEECDRLRRLQSQQEDYVQSLHQRVHELEQQNRSLTHTLDTHLAQLIHDRDTLQGNIDLVCHGLATATGAAGAGTAGNKRWSAAGITDYYGPQMGAQPAAGFNISRLGELQDRINTLERQINTCASDYHSERSDKERAETRVRDLERLVNNMQEKIYELRDERAGATTGTRPQASRHRPPSATSGLRLSLQPVYNTRMPVSSNNGGGGAAVSEVKRTKVSTPTVLTPPTMPPVTLSTCTATAATKPLSVDTSPATPVTSTGGPPQVPSKGSGDSGLLMPVTALTTSANPNNSQVHQQSPATIHQAGSRLRRRQLNPTSILRRRTVAIMKDSDMAAAVTAMEQMFAPTTVADDNGNTNGTAMGKPAESTSGTAMTDSAQPQANSRPVTYRHEAKLNISSCL